MVKKRNTCYNIQQVFLFSVMKKAAGDRRQGRGTMKKSVFRAAVSLVLGAALFFAMAVQPAAAESYYVENEWNYVDGSIDSNHGIPENATGVLDRIRRKGVLRVATEPYFAPFEFIDPEQLDPQRKYAGADMKLAELIADRMGVELQIVPLEFTQVLPALTENQCDLTISAIAFTPSRASAYAMSKGYYFPETSASTAFVIREENRENITSLEDLADKTIIVQSSSLQEALASKHIINYKEFRRVSSVQAVYEAVRKGRADAGVVDMETASNYIRNNADAGLILADNLYFALEEQFLGHRIVAKKGELQLIYFVNDVIDEVLENGTYLKWIEEAQKRADELGL